jgi:transcriptional regulator with XRE-family HTH domain
MLSQNIGYTPIMFDARFLRLLRQARSLSQADVAEAVGVTQPRVSLFERSERRPTRRQMQRLERTLALGEAREGEEQPAFSLAVRMGGQGLQLALTAGPRLGVYRESGLAAEAARIVRRLHPGKSGRIGVVPVWLEAAFGAVVAVKTGRVEADDVYFVDDNSEAPRLVAAVIDHGLGVADWLGTIDASAPSNDIAALADAVLSRRERELVASS